LNAQPFFLSGSWDEVNGAGEARGVSALLMKGASADERKQAEALVAYAGAARTFYSTLLGPPPDVPVRLVAVTRGAGFNDGGTILLDSASFRRTKIDSATALLIAESVAHLWIGGEVVVRGEGGGVVREGLSRYLATLFLEKQFGAEAALAERLRERIAYAAVSKRDAPLSLTTPLDDTYYNSVSNKGAMIWRLAERTTGPGGLGPVIRELLQAKKGDRNGLTLAAVRAALVERGGANMKTLLDYGLDKPTDADLLVGLPVQREGQWVTALRNLGSVDVTVPVVATTDRGERLTTEANVPARNFGEALFKTANRIVRVEIDPDKLYPQLDYSNDIAPRAQLTEEALADATRFLGAQDYAKAETTARQLLSTLPRLQEARIVLARALLAQNKLDEAEREFRAALDEKLPTPATLAWTSIGLGEISLRKGQTAEAARRFNEAVRADAEYASTLTARASRIKAEAGANSSPTVDESARAFLAQLDQTIRGGRRTELDALIVPGELAKFSSGVITSQPEIWQTRVLRTETLDANRLAADVSLNTKELGREQAGTAVFILTRVGGAWKLADIQFFEVR
ncbi:MAG: tetratricopeptide repeat protein, partial [Pyrinomonadaceae bacterium]